MSSRGEILRRFLGVAAAAGPLEILGVERGGDGVHPHAEALRAALARRRRQLAGHPAAGTPEGTLAQAALEDAARALGVAVAATAGADGEAVASDPDEGAAVPLPDLDLELLHALRQGRGLGRSTLLRVRSIAQRRGTAPEAIIARLRMLRPDPRLRARPLGVGARAAAVVAPPDAVTSEVVALLDRLDRAVGDEPIESIESDRRGERVRVVLRTVGVSLAVLVALVAIVALATRASRDRGNAEQGRAIGAIAPPAPSLPESSAGRLPDGTAVAAPRGAPPAPGHASTPPAMPLPAVPAAWRRETPRSQWGVPLLEGEGGRERGRRVEAALAAVEAVPARLLDLASRLRGEIVQPTAEQVALWGELQRVAAATWPLRSEAQRRAVVAASVECLEAIDSWRSAVALLEALGPIVPASGGFDGDGSPSAWTGAWGAGLLGELAVRGFLAPPVRREVERSLQALGLPRRIGFVGRTPLEETQARWLAAQAAVWALQPIERSGVEGWAWWFAAVEAIEPGTLREAVLIEALRQVLRFWSVEVDGPQSLRAALVAQLTASLDPLHSESPVLVREALLGWIDPAGGVAAEPAALVATRLAALPGLGALAELAPLSGQSRPAERSRFAQEALRRWPDLEAWRRVPVEADLASRWRELLGAVRDRPRRDDASLLAGLVQASRLQEAAALLSEAPQEADAILRSIEAALLGSGLERGVATERRSTARGRDGVWAEAMTRALGDRARRIDLLRDLRGRGGGDLGPLDAAALVRTAVADGPEVRAIAEAVLIDRLAEGPEVLRQLAIRMDDAPQRAALGELLSRLCGVALPAVDDAAFASAARRALLAQRLRAERSLLPSLEDLARAYAASIEIRTRRVRGDGVEVDASDGAAPRVEDPATAMALLGEAWRAKLLARGGAEDLRSLAEIDALRARRMGHASHPPQRLVAEQAAVAELLLAWERQRPVGERPETAPIDAILYELSRRRSGASSSLEQALEQELVIASLWPRQWRIRGDREDRRDQGGDIGDREAIE